MKKFLIAVLILIPVLVVLALNATSSIILAISTPPNPSAIVIRDSSSNIIAKSDGSVTAEVITLDGEDYITVEVLPTLTRDKGVVFRKTEGTGEVQFTLMEGYDDRYIITPVALGDATILVSAEARVDINVVLEFYVTSNLIQQGSYYLYDDTGAAYDPSVPYKLTDTTRLFVDVTPIDALEQAFWSSKDTSIVTVSDNGTLRIIGSGETQITLTIFDKASNEHNLVFTVNTESALVKAQKAYAPSALEGDDEAAIEWIRNILLLKEDAEIEASGGEQNVYVVTYTNSKGKVTECEVTLTYFEEGSLTFLDDFSTIYTNNGPYYLSVGYLSLIYDDLADDSLHPTGITYSSSDESVFYIDEANDKRLVPLKAGTAVLTASGGGETVTQTVVVRERPNSFSLTLDSSAYERGIQLSRTWGLTWWQEDGTYTNTYTLGIRNATGNYDVVWSTDGGDAVVFEPGATSVNITFNESAAGKAIKVTASLLINGKAMSLARSFTFNMNADPHAVNITNFNQLQTLNNTSTTAVLQNNLEVTDVFRPLKSSIFGNGFTVNVVDSLMQQHNSEIFLINEGNVNDITIEDIIFIGLDNWDEYTKEQKANCRKLFHCSWSRVKAHFRFLQIEHFRRGIELNNAGYTDIEGSIFGDNYDSQVYTYYYTEIDRPEVFTEQQIAEGYPTLILTNTVYKSTQYPSIYIGSASGTSNYEDYTTNFVPNIYINGICRFYNWKDENAFVNMFSALLLETLVSQLGSDQNTLAQAANLLGSMLADTIGHTSNPDLFYYDSATQTNWASPGVFILGVVFAPSLRTFYKNSNDVDVREMKVTIDGYMQTFVRTIFTNGGNYAPPALSSSGGAMDPAYFVGTNFSGGTPTIKPGDPVPSNYDLYAQLTAGI